jgi:RND family efflux transporter MFP subunit
LREIRVLSGTLQASTRFDVSAKVGGLIEQMKVDLGDEIDRGQIVAVLDDDEFEQAVVQAEAELAVRQAELASAQAELRRVQREYDRLQTLAERRVVTNVELDEITATLESQKASVALAEARVRQARAEQEVARIQQRYTTIRAAWEGGPDTATVSERYEDAGNTVQVGDAVIGVVALDPLTAVVSVTERDYTRLRVGQPATLTTDARPGDTFDAEIVRIAPIFREASRQARIELRVANPDGQLRPGMFVRVRVVLREGEADTIVPAAALVQRGDEQVVFQVADDGETVTEHPVTVGIREAEQVEIVSPPLSGQVVVLGQHLLEDGAAIRVTDRRLGPDG